MRKQLLETFHLRKMLECHIVVSITHTMQPIHYAVVDLLATQQGSASAVPELEKKTTVAMLAR
jgi:hypothetical protein